MDAKMKQELMSLNLEIKKIEEEKEAFSNGCDVKSAGKEIVEFILKTDEPMLIGHDNNPYNASADGCTIS